MFPSLRNLETQHSFCVSRVCAPKKHHEQQCVLVCQNLNCGLVAVAELELVTKFLISHEISL